MAESVDTIRFRTVLDPRKVGNRAGSAVLPPAEASRALGRRGPAPIRATVKGDAREASAQPTGEGRPYVWVNREVREAGLVEWGKAWTRSWR
jgi:hypothetical protein